MKVLLISDHLSSHTLKWAISLSERNIDILIFSLNFGNDFSYSKYNNIEVETYNVGTETVKSGNLLTKSSYLFAISRLKKTIKRFNPDILHAHYATSYGILGALSGFHPFIISVWGSDVYDFPNNFITRFILKYNLRKADRILSTSHVMAEETKKYTSSEIEVTPFGIDIESFRPMKVDSIFPKDALVVGTIKALEDKYGVDYLIRAFKIVRDQRPNKSIKLLLVGTGSKELELKNLVADLGISDEVVFTGRIPHDEVPRYMNMLDVYVALSTLDSESFGVAILEASACEKPVVVSNVGGLPEVVNEGVTGFVVDKCNEIAASKAMGKLIDEPALRVGMGLAGRVRVIEHYNWGNCVNQMTEIYRKVTNEK